MTAASTIRSGIGLIRQKSLRGALVVTMSVTLAVALLLGGLAVFTLIFANDQLAWEARQADAALSTSATVGSYLRQQRGNLSTLGAFSKARLREALEVPLNQLRRDPELIELIRVDEQGELIASAGPTILANQFPLIQSPWYQGAATRGSYLSEIMYEADGEAYLIIGINSNGGSPSIGIRDRADVTAARVRARELWSMIAQARLGRTGMLYLIDRAGRLIAFTDPQLVRDSKLMPNHPALATSEMAGEVLINEYVNFRGVEVMSAATAVPDTNWIVVAELPVSEAVVVPYTTGLILGAALLIFALLTLGSLTWLLNRQVFQPLDLLRTAAAQIQRGDPGAQVHVQREDEIGQVGHAFNIMAAAISEREQRLQQFAASLEAQVAERTAELRRRSEERDQLQSQIITAQAEALEQLATPIIPISEQVVVMPLVGLLNAQRSREILQALLIGIERYQARVAIIDVTGVSMVDTQVARGLLDATVGVSLLGAKVFLTGIQPEVAQTLVGLGDDLSGLRSYATLQQGIAQAMKGTGKRE